MSTTTPKTIAARIERQLACEILRGQRPPGTQLPPVRALATEFSVTAPTIQRVVERLEANGLVAVKRGSGITVNDPHLSGELSLLPVWFEAFAEQPERAADILADFLELRRVVGTHLIRTAFDELRSIDLSTVPLTAIMDPDSSIDEVIAAELAVTRAVLDAADQFAVRAVFRTTEQLLYQVPLVAESLYGDRGYHRRIARRLVSAFTSGDTAAGTAEAVDKTFVTWDRRTIERFLHLSRSASRP